MVKLILDSDVRYIQEVFDEIVSIMEKSKIVKSDVIDELVKTRNNLHRDTGCVFSWSNLSQFFVEDMFVGYLEDCDEADETMEMISKKRKNIDQFICFDS